jgi:hypothetical protein
MLWYNEQQGGLTMSTGIPDFACRDFHDSHFKHSNALGHHCDNNDSLWVCQDCDEFVVCKCFEFRPAMHVPVQTEIQLDMLGEPSSLAGFE